MPSPTIRIITFRLLAIAAHFSLTSAATSPALTRLLLEHALPELAEPLAALGVGTPAELLQLDEEDHHSLLASLKKYEQRRFDAMRAALNATELETRTKNKRRLGRLPPGTALVPFDTTVGNTLPDVLSPLKEALLDGYDHTTPPGGLVEPAVQVRLGLNLYKFNGVDLSRGTMEVHVWLRMTWVDPRLAWDPAQWGGETRCTTTSTSWHLDSHNAWRAVSAAGIETLTMPGVPPTDLEGSSVWVPEVELYA